MPNYIYLLSELESGVLRLTLNRPERRNALNPDLVNELLYALELARADDAVQVVVITGAGRAFCAGGDFAQSAGAKRPESYDVPPRGGFVELNRALRDLGKPTIAMVNGHAMGGGFGLALACDLTIVSESAKLGTPEIDIGLFPMMIMPAIFRHITRKQGLKMILLGERLTARQALEYGCITEVVAPEALESRVAELALALTKKSSAVLRLGLQAYHQQQEMSFDDALPYLQEMLNRCLQTEDFREGISAFLQKREPQFKGR
ncbi:MAG: enoyl-CoA hydratase/isomerase family protein [Myxococcales bacterium]|nr:enoyl-CoA hydratase/isomerase family protein [Myxococcales bacterium]